MGSLRFPVEGVGAARIEYVGTALLDFKSLDNASESASRLSSVFERPVNFK